jgi:3-methyladenine DNA glycosylase AlkD
MSHDDVTALVKDLWAPAMHETRMVAIELLDLYSNLLAPDDSGLVEQMIDTSHTWAYVDNLSASIMGGMVVRYPALMQVLDRWAKDENFWLRRAAMLALLIELRNGGGDWDRFTRYADSMLDEKEFFIRKAIGWILRDTARKRKDMVYQWLRPRAHRASTLDRTRGDAAHAEGEERAADSRGEEWSAGRKVGGRTCHCEERSDVAISRTQTTCDVCKHSSSRPDSSRRHWDDAGHLRSGPRDLTVFLKYWTV